MIWATYFQKFQKIICIFFKRDRKPGRHVMDIINVLTNMLYPIQFQFLPKSS